MIKRYLLDTNMVTYLVKGRSPAARKRLLEVSPRSVICVSSITAGEIRYGLARQPVAERTRQAVEDFLTQTVILPWDQAESEVYGKMRAAQESIGKPLGDLDTLIAAHALTLQATLVTADTAFARVRGLSIENWATDL